MFRIDFFTETNYRHYALPSEVWWLILTYVSIIDLFNVPFCSKFFYACARDNKRLDDKFYISKRILSNCQVYGHFVLTYYMKLRLRLEKNYSESTFLLVKKSC